MGVNGLTCNEINTTAAETAHKSKCMSNSTDNIDNNDGVELCCQLQVLYRASCMCKREGRSLITQKVLKINGSHRACTNEDKKN